MKKLFIFGIFLIMIVSVNAQDLNENIISHYYFNNSTDATGRYNATTFEAGGVE